MTDQPPLTDQTASTVAQTPVATVTNELPLSEHAEDVLAEAVGHGFELDDQVADAPTKTVKEVLTSMINDKEELFITLEYGTGESGVDQASWNIEVTSLQRAFVRSQKSAEIAAMSQKVMDELENIRGKIDRTWVNKTAEFRNVMNLFERGRVTRQEIDDFHHSIYGKDLYLGYLYSVLNGSDEHVMLGLVGNLNMLSREIEVERAELINPAQADNNLLADAIIGVNGDIDKLSITLERDFSSAVLGRNLSEAARMASVLREDFLKRYKMWAHSFDLNVREVLATERSATNGEISEKASDQLKDMLIAGSEHVDNLLSVMT